MELDRHKANLVTSAQRSPVAIKRGVPLMGTRNHQLAPIESGWSSAPGEPKATTQFDSDATVISGPILRCRH
jgi:hypothetical protein